MKTRARARARIGYFEKLLKGSPKAGVCKYHGEKTVIQGSSIKTARRQFKLTPDDGISDEDFYSKK